MKIIDVEQGSAAWIEARLGLPTASNFASILTRTGKPSGGQERYLAELVAEWFLGEPVSDYVSEFMQRGTKEEASAIAAYEFDKDVDTETVGLCLTDDGRAGASPDRLVAGGVGLVEIKVPSAVVQTMYVLSGPPDDYKVQVQGQLWVCERQWDDLYLYHPHLPNVWYRHERDDKFIGLLSAEVRAFCDRLDAAKAKLADRRAEYLAQKAANVDNEVPAELG